MQEQVDLAAEQLGQFGTRAAADFLDAFALVAEDDRALIVARDEDLLVDFGAAVGAVRELLGLDGRLVRQFFVKLAMDLSFSGSIPAPSSSMQSRMWSPCWEALRVMVP